MPQALKQKERILSFRGAALPRMVAILKESTYTLARHRMGSYTSCKVVYLKHTNFAAMLCRRHCTAAFSL